VPRFSLAGEEQKIWGEIARDRCVFFVSPIQNLDHRKSTRVYLFMLGGASGWKVKLSPTGCLSTLNTTLFQRAKQALNLPFLLRDLGFGPLSSATTKAPSPWLSTPPTSPSHATLKCVSLLPPNPHAQNGCRLHDQTNTTHHSRASLPTGLRQPARPHPSRTHCAPASLPSLFLSHRSCLLCLPTSTDLSFRGVDAYTPNFQATTGDMEEWRNLD
jgi:hypothetical protein